MSVPAEQLRERPKGFICIRECQWNDTRFRFGDTVNHHKLPNHHFFEIQPHQVGMAARDILVEELYRFGIDVEDHWHDTRIQAAYDKAIMDWKEQEKDPQIKAESEKPELPTRENLIKTAKEIKARWHYKWTDERIMKSIEKRKKELKTNGDNDSGGVV